MANLLSAIGGAAPALTAEWRALQAEERENRLAKHQEAMLPLKMEEAQQNIAVNRETINKMRQEQAMKQQVQDKLNKPVNVHQIFSGMGFMPEMVDDIKSVATGLGVDPKSGFGTVGDVGSILETLTKTGKMKEYASGMSQYYSKQYESLFNKYEKMKNEGGGNVEQMTKIKAELDKVQADSSKWGGILAKTMDFSRSKENIGNTIRQAQQDGSWDTDFTPQDKFAIMRAYESGDDAGAKDILGKIVARSAPGSVEGRLARDMFGRSFVELTDDEKKTVLDRTEKGKLTEAKEKELDIKERSLAMREREGELNRNIRDMINQRNLDFRYQAMEKMNELRARLPASQQKDINDKRRQVERYAELATGFADKYAGAIALGPTMTSIHERFGSQPERVNWWKNWRSLDTKIRNELFGATLTQYEKADWDRVTINENTDPKIVRDQLALRAKIAQDNLIRHIEGFEEAGYSVNPNVGKTGTKKPIGNETPTKKELPKF